MSYETERDMMQLIQMLLAAERRAEYWQDEYVRVRQELWTLEEQLPKVKAEKESAPSADTDKGATQ